MSEITIRAAEPDDLAQLHQLYLQPSIIRQTLSLPYVPQAIYQRRVEWHENIHHLVALIDGQIVGDISLVVQTRPRRRHCGGLGMAVHRDFRRRGIGRSLMQAALELAVNWYNLTRIELDVFTDNEPAIALYQSMGFELEGTLRQYAMRDGQAVDAHIMSIVR